MADKGIVIIGSLNLDRTVEVETLPRAGETIAATGSRIGLGGKGANQAVAAARAGASVAMIGMTGDDDAGRWLTASLEGDGVEVSGVMVNPSAPTGEALIMVERSGENAIVVNGGTNSLLVPADIVRHRDRIGGAGLILLQCEIPADTIEAAIEIARRAGVPVLLDPAPAAPVRQTWLKHVAFLTPNENELAVLTGRPPGDRSATLVAARELVERGVGCVLAKRGADGVVIVTDAEAFHLPALQLYPKDTTGAGDMFAGAFAAQWLRTQDVEASAAFATVAAGLSTLKAGASASYPRRVEILARLDASRAVLGLTALS